MQNNKNVVLGILAHVDAGKTTLSEAMLHLSGKIKNPGRVDHGDSYLDTHKLERARGITIFSKQAQLELAGSSLTLLDTPGHVDFSAEAERTLRVLDYAVLVISGLDGVQAHTQTLWRLLKRYRVPCMLFVSKMDLPGKTREELMAELHARLDGACVDFGSRDEQFAEAVAMCDERVMEEYLETGSIGDEDIARLLRERKLFPCFFGSGLKLQGVEPLLDAIDSFTRPCEDLGEFAATVFKIERDAQGRRMSYVKLSGGELRVKTALKYKDANGAELEEKINELRIYSGMKYSSVDAVSAGQVCALIGLSGTYPGQGLGAQRDSEAAVLEPVMSYRLILPRGVDAAVLWPKLQLLLEEDPQLHLEWNSSLRDITVQLMGRVQTEVFISLVKERFDVDIRLDAGRIMYKETITAPVEGVGHFEPLRHYAEVHLIIEPLEQGSGIVLDTSCSEDALDRSWQRLILSHLQEKQQLGVLTGSPLTDVKITLAAGRAHIKHTEGGDFRQATYRALRQGLMQAESVLLEPYYHFVIEVPPEQIGRVISDVRMMKGTFSSPEDAGELTRIEGSAPVSEMNEYITELTSYTRGKGRMSLRLEGYKPCHKQKEVVEAIAYDAQGDVENTADSVFCAHGAGFNVKWDEVFDYMHLERCLKPKTAAPRARDFVHRSIDIDERELEAIMEREFGPIKRPQYGEAVRNEAPAALRFSEKKREYIIVDGYNLIFAWEELRSLAEDRLDLARTRLMDILSSYCGYTKAELVLVFDGYRVQGNPGTRFDYHNIHVVYTKDNETGDAYIERLANDIGKNYSVRVVTNDNLIRLSTLRSGVLGTSTKFFEQELQTVLKAIDEHMRLSNIGAHKTRIKDGKQ